MQVNRAYPNRSKASDGTIGDAAHASRSSDHNPWVKDGKTGVVTAIDFTHDPDSGLDAGALGKALIASRDSRIKYIIWDRKIISGEDGPSPWRWRKYSGKNPHNKHVHISVKSSKASYDDTSPWTISAVNVAKFAEVPEDDHSDQGGEPVEMAEVAQAGASGGFFSKVKTWGGWLTGGGFGVAGIFDVRFWIALLVFALILLAIALCIPRIRRRLIDRVERMLGR
jgi:hypothetical protein